MQRIAMPWLVYHMTGSALLLGVVGFAGQIPAFLVSPVAGVLTDRWSRYHVLLASQIISMMQAFVLAWLCLAGIIQIWHIVVLSIVLGCVNAFDIPSRHSFVIDMVEKKEDRKKESELFKELKEGLNYTFGFPPIKHLILLLGLVSFMGMSYSVLMPVFAKEILHGGSHTYGFLMGAAGFGALFFLRKLPELKTIIRPIYIKMGIIPEVATGIQTASEPDVL